MSLRLGFACLPLAVLLAGCGVERDLGDPVVLESHAWGSYHWKNGSAELALNVGDNVSSAWDAYLDEAIADWNVSADLALTEVVSGKDPKKCQPTAGRIEVCNAKYGYRGWLGIANIWASGSHITQATTRVNDSYFSSGTYNTPAWRRLVMCQEIGHDFGLDHQDETFGNANLGSCMDYTNDPDGPPSNEHPNAHDYEQLAAIYAHDDSASPIGAVKTDDVAVEDAGILVRGGRDRGFSIYVRDLGDGNRVITHVLWTLDDALATDDVGGRTRF